MLGRQFEQLELFSGQSYDQPRVEERPKEPHSDPGPDYLRGEHAVGQMAILPWDTRTHQVAAWDASGRMTMDREHNFGVHTEHGTIYTDSAPNEIRYPGATGSEFEMQTLGPDRAVYTNQNPIDTEYSHTGVKGRNRTSADTTESGWTIEDLRHEEIHEPPVGSMTPEGHLFVWNGNHRLAAMRRRAEGMARMRVYKRAPGFESYSDPPSFEYS